MTRLATMGGPLFKWKVLLTDGRASHHVPRGVLPSKFSQHSGAWWLRQGLAASPNIVHDIGHADVIYVYDFCYVAWSEAKAHHSNAWGPAEDLYVDPDLYLTAAYHFLLKNPAFVKTGGSNFVFFHSHPALYVSYNVMCKPEYDLGLHLVAEAQVRRNCRPPASLRRLLVVPYASFPLYPSPEAARPTLLYFRASCGGTSPGKGLRRALVGALQATPSSTISCDSLDWEDKSLHEMAESRFCIIPPGDTASSRRLSEAVLMGCVPVFVGPPFAALPLASVARYALFALAFEVQNTSEWLSGHSLGPLDALGSHMSSVPVSSLADIPSELAKISRIGYESLRYQLAVSKPQFSFVQDPAEPSAGLSDVLYSRMCYHAYQSAM